MTDNRPWWVAISNTNCERRATLGLEAKGFEVWWPTRIIETWQGGRSSPRRKVAREVAAAPGYLFVRHSHPQGWPEMIGVDGLRAVLCIAFDPVRVSAAEVERWKADLMPLDMPMVDDAFRVGDTVMISEGPFRGFRGVLERFLARGAVEVAVSAFGRSAPVSVARECVEAT